MLRYFWVVLCFVSLVFNSVNGHAASDSAPKPPVSASVSPVQFQQYIDAYQRYVKQASKDDSKKSQWPYLNSLILTNSPYLIKHAADPIDWQTWNNPALETAKQQNKLIFVSIGFSTCYWCQVMAEESFSDVAVAEVLNQDFVAIKIDREVLPDIDEYFTQSLAAVKGTAGWPVTAILNPDQELLYIESYVDRTSLLGALKRFGETNKNSPKRLQGQADLIARILKTNKPAITEKIESLSEENWQEFDANLLESLDSENGGKAGQPKFPSASMLLYLLDRLQSHPENKHSQQIQQLIKTQLYNMSTRGLYDPIHGGFHRYVSDSKWQIPHYEKMLYTQALLIEVYSRAYRVLPSGHSEGESLSWLENVVEETVVFLNNFLKGPQNTYYSALDAVYQGREGGFYLHSQQEIASLGKLLSESSGISLYQKQQGKGKAEADPGFGLHVQRPYPAQFQQIKNTLKNNRDQQQLYTDKKILTSWNALLISGLSQAYIAFGKDIYKQLASQLAEALWQHQRHNGQLQRVSLNGNTGSTAAALEDYALLARACLDLFDITQQEIWLQRAITLMDSAVQKHFQPEVEFVASNQTAIQQHINLDDGELLNPQAVMLENIHRLHKRTGKTSLTEAMQAAQKQLQNQMTSKNLEQPYARKVFRQQHSLAEPIQYFARGNGRVALKQQTDCSHIINVDLQPGWHVNANTVLDDDFLPTRVEFLHPASENLEAKENVLYPNHKLLLFGPSKRKLSVFENRFPVFVKGQGPITVHLQACSEPDNLCLLPEQVDLFMADCKSVVSYSRDF